MSYMQKLKDFSVECGRVLRVTKKPTKEEYMVTAKVSGIGLLLIGLIGFVFHIINELFSIIALAAVVLVLVIILFYLKRKQ